MSESPDDAIYTAGEVLQERLYTQAEVDRARIEAAVAMREVAAVECDRHSQFCKTEWDRGGDAAHLSARYAEANYLAQRIRSLPPAEQKTLEGLLAEAAERVIRSTSKMTARHIVATAQALEPMEQSFRAAGIAALEEFWFRCTGHHLDWTELKLTIRPQPELVDTAAPLAAWLDRLLRAERAACYRRCSVYMTDTVKRYVWNYAPNLIFEQWAKAAEGSETNGR